MSRQELADEVNKHLFETVSRRFDLDENYVGKLERGEHRWPGALYRAAFRFVLDAATDAELGFHIIRGLRQPAVAMGPQLAVAVLVPHDGGAFARSGRTAVTGPGEPRRPEPDDLDQPDGFDLWELNEALRGTRLSHVDLTAAEMACGRLDRHYAQMSPQIVLPMVSIQLRRTVRALSNPQPVGYRRRLCALAGRLAGLRAWLLFDLADHRAADAWYAAAIQAASESEDHSLCGWLFGARSLIPSYRHDHRAALALIGHGLSAADRCADTTVRTWLHALDARARAGIGDTGGHAAAQRRADRLAARTAVDERRHGMDFTEGNLDLTYYAGTSWLLLAQPDAAVEFLNRSLTALPAMHVKARAILLLALATAAARQRRVDEAVDLTCRALTIAETQPIMPILQRARDVRTELASASTVTLAEIDEHLGHISANLGVPTSGHQP